MASNDTSVEADPGGGVRVGQLRKILAATPPFFSGLWLVLLYFVFVSLVVLSLGAHQLQYSIRSFPLEGGEYLSLWEISDIYENLDSHYYPKNGNNTVNNTVNSETNGSTNRKIETHQDNIDKPDSPIRDSSIGDFILAIHFYRVQIPLWTFNVIPDFSSLPPGVLTIILVLAMGALGGTIHLTYDYLDRKNDRRFGVAQSIGYYIFRPFLGSITALSIYVLAKAGVLVVSNPVNSDFGDALSPFFVSFIGIISGLLAEQAVETIQRTGKQWFSAAPTVDRERWAHKVRENLDGMAEYELADAVGVNQTLLAAWLDQKRPVPEAKQALIAASLRKPARELFTDIRPADAPAEEAESNAGA